MCWLAPAASRRTGAAGLRRVGRAELYGAMYWSTGLSLVLSRSALACRRSRRWPPSSKFKSSSSFHSLMSIPCTWFLSPVVSCEVSLKLKGSVPNPPLLGSSCAAGDRSDSGWIGEPSVACTAGCRTCSGCAGLIGLNSFRGGCSPAARSYC